MNPLARRVRAVAYARMRAQRVKTGPLVPYARPRLRWSCPDCGDRVVDRRITALDWCGIGTRIDAPLLQAHAVCCPQSRFTVGFDGDRLTIEEAR